MAIDLRSAGKFRCEIDESGKVQVLPSAGEVFGMESEREERDVPTPDLTHAAAQWHFIKGFAWGAAVVLCIAAVGWAVSLR